MKSWSHNFACKILRNRQGSVAIHVALTASVIIGMAGLGAEITYLLYKHRQLQVVADAAALSAGAVLANSKSSPTTEARAIAAHLGFVNGANGVTITVNNPPRLSTHYAGDEKAIEVVVKTAAVAVRGEDVPFGTLRRESARDRPCPGQTRLPARAPDLAA